MFIYFKLFSPLLEISMHKDAYRSILIAANKKSIYIYSKIIHLLIYKTLMKEMKT